jgi:ABC-type transport system involved in multi-copper enzyme maturation permease subunit
VLALIWTHAIVCCTRVPAGEVDGGTIDVLLGLPVSRWQVLVSETVVWLGSSLIVIALVILGNAIGTAAADPALPPSAARRVITAVNLLCLYISVGSFAWLVSALSDRRSRAITVVFGVVLASFLLNYVAQFWSVADGVSFLSILVYYRPLVVLRDGSWPIKDMSVLLTLSVLLWFAAGIVFARRDLSTV